MSDFLETEYKECISLLKYYDERHQSLLKFSSALSSGVPSILLAIYGIKDLPSNIFWNFSFFISAASAIGLFTIFCTMIQTRLYFIYPTRQANAIRGFLLSSTEFKENQMYLSTNFNAFKLRSTQTLLNLFTCLQVGLFTGAAIFSLYESKAEEAIVSASICGAIVTITIFLYSSFYLFNASSHHPDKSVHREENSSTTLSTNAISEQPPSELATSA